ncbi:hypothetical protein [Sunxiuqinia sp. sy24]|uniref:hypothetical protein n=1 Tax=Sunxiuqinia sp. sy24 TaxID=3461495 RepID=UPI004046085E
MNRRQFCPEKCNRRNEQANARTNYKQYLSPPLHRQVKGALAENLARASESLAGGRMKFSGFFFVSLPIRQAGVSFHPKRNEKYRWDKVWTNKTTTSLSRWAKVLLLTKRRKQQLAFTETNTNSPNSEKLAAHSSPVLSISRKIHIFTIQTHAFKN